MRADGSGVEKCPLLCIKTGDPSPNPLYSSDSLASESLGQLPSLVSELSWLISKSAEATQIPECLGWRLRLFCLSSLLPILQMPPPSRALPENLFSLFLQKKYDFLKISLFKRQNYRQVWCYMPVIPPLRRLRQEIKFKANLSYKGGFVLKNQNQQITTTIRKDKNATNLVLPIIFVL
jgi:hypothetical protein